MRSHDGGFKDDRGFNDARRLLGRMDQIHLAGEDLPIESARNFRKLRVLGLIVCGTVDTIIATRCISDGYRLLHSDRDFDGFEEHLGLRVVKGDA